MVERKHHQLGDWALGLILSFSIFMICSPAWSQNWVLLEVRDLPAACQQPLTCTADSHLALRNVMNLAPNERAVLFQTLNGISTFRGLPEDDQAAAAISLPQMTEALHPLPLADKLVPLIDHPGVYFNGTALDENELTTGFSERVISRLSAAGVRFLTEEEMDATPGRPKLTVRFTERTESAGCIIPFAVSLSIDEETVMARNPSIKLAGRAWSGQQKENLANNNYTPYDALDEVISSFLNDWGDANP